MTEQITTYSGRIEGAPDQKQAFQDWCHDHGGDPDIQQNHKRTVGPGERIDHVATCDLGHTTVTAEWKSAGNYVKFDNETHRFSSVTTELGTFTFLGKGDGGNVDIRGRIQHPDARIAKWQDNQTEPENGYVRDYTG